MKRRVGDSVASYGLLFATALTVKESAVLFRAKPTTEIVPAVVESEAAPASEPAAAVVLSVN